MLNKILVTGTNNITGINIVKALLLNSSNFVYGCDYREINIANKFCENFVVPKSSSIKYIDEILNIVNAYNINCIIPSNDHELRALAESNDILLSKGVHLNGYSPNILLFLDKLATYNLFKKNGILTPDLYNKSNVEFPVVVRKCEMGIENKFVYILNSKDEFKSISKEIINSAILTKFINGEEYTVDVICDFSSNIYSVVPRLRKEVIGGMVSFAEIVNNSVVINATKNLVSKLKLTGINCIQCIVENDKCYFIEINPRPGSGMDLTTNSGVNMPQIWLDILNKRNVSYVVPEWGLKLLRYYDGYFFR